MRKSKCLCLLHWSKWIFKIDYDHNDNCNSFCYINPCMQCAFLLTFGIIHYLFLRTRLDELRMFLENETWELCPVKSNFSILQLHVSLRTDKSVLYLVIFKSKPDT